MTLSKKKVRDERVKNRNSIQNFQTAAHTVTTSHLLPISSICISKDSFFTSFYGYLASVAAIMKRWHAYMHVYTHTHTQRIAFSIIKTVWVLWTKYKAPPHNQTHTWLQKAPISMLLTHKQTSNVQAPSSVWPGTDIFTV